MTYFFAVVKLSIKRELKNLPLQYFCENSRKYTSYMVTAVCVLSPLSCPTLCDTVHCSPPGCSAHWILQARVLVWIAMPSSSDLPDPEIKLNISYLFFTGRQVFYHFVSIQRTFIQCGPGHHRNPT